MRKVGEEAQRPKGPKAERPRGKVKGIFTLEIVSCEREGDSFWGKCVSFWVAFEEQNAP